MYQYTPPTGYRDADGVMRLSPDDTSEVIDLSWDGTADDVTRVRIADGPASLDLSFDNGD